MYEQWKFKQVLVYSLMVSSLYALFELHLQPWVWISFGKWQVYGLSTYHIFFMLPLYIMISIVPVRHNALSRKSLYLAAGIFFLSLLAEDYLYFAFQFTTIKAGMWTTQWGYVSVLGQTVPDWYVAYSIFSFAAFSQVYTLSLPQARQQLRELPAKQLKSCISAFTKLRRSL